MATLPAHRTCLTFHCVAMIIAVTHPQLLGGLPEYMTYLQCAGLPIQCVLDLLYDNTTGFFRFILNSQVCHEKR